MLHLIKLHAGTDLLVAHWRAEILGFLSDAAARFTPAMRQLIDLDRIFSRACLQAKAALHPDDLPSCPNAAPGHWMECWRRQPIWMLWWPFFSDIVFDRLENALRTR